MLYPVFIFHQNKTVKPRCLLFVCWAVYFALICDCFECRFLDTSAYVYGLLIPSAILVLATFSYLVRAAVVARYVASMQIDRRTRDKMRRKRTLQLLLFTKVINTPFIVALLALSSLDCTKDLINWMHCKYALSIMNLLSDKLFTAKVN